MKKIFSVLLIFLFSLVFVLTASAQTNPVFGVKSTTAALWGSAGTAAVQGGYFGATLGERGVLMFGIDFARISIGSEGDDISATTFIPHGGVKYYFRDVGDGEVVPYALGEFFKAFTSVNIPSLDLGSIIGGDSVDVSEFTGPVEDVLSPFGFNVGFGAEYFFTDEFSLGGEYGLRYFISSSDLDGTSLDTNLGNTYVAITLNFVL